MAHFGEILILSTLEPGSIHGYRKAPFATPGDFLKAAVAMDPGLRPAFVERKSAYMGIAGESAELEN